jgi:hypothetical protein
MEILTSTLEEIKQRTDQAVAIRQAMSFDMPRKAFVKLNEAQSFLLDSSIQLRASFQDHQIKEFLSASEMIDNVFKTEIKETFYTN